MLAELNRKLSLKIPVSYLVEAPTARKFAELLMLTKDVPSRYLVSMQPEGSLPRFTLSIIFWETFSFIVRSLVNLRPPPGVRYPTTCRFDRSASDLQPKGTRL